MHAHDSWLYGLNALANLVIVAGYVLVPFTVLRWLPLTRPVLTAGALFFSTCAVTHAAMALGHHDGPVLLINHLVQGVAVVWFVLGFARLLRAADSRRLRRERGVAAEVADES